MLHFVRALLASGYTWEYAALDSHIPFVSEEVDEIKTNECSKMQHEIISKKNGRKKVLIRCLIIIKKKR